MDTKAMPPIQLLETVKEGSLALQELLVEMRAPGQLNAFFTILVDAVGKAYVIGMEAAKAE